MGVMVKLIWNAKDPADGGEADTKELECEMDAVPRVGEGVSVRSERKSGEGEEHVTQVVTGIVETVGHQHLIRKESIFEETVVCVGLRDVL